MTSRPIGGIVLAAGAGTRFGSPKALLELDGELLVERAVGLLTEAGCDPVVVVLGAGAGEVAERADLGAAEVVINDAWERGMGSSLRAGLTALHGCTDAAVVALADQPGITPDAVAALIDAWQGSERPAATATFAGRQRPPVLLGADVWTEVAAEATGDAGARAWVRGHPDRVVEVPCDALADPTDIDTPDDLASRSG